MKKIFPAVFTTLLFLSFILNSPKNSWTQAEQEKTFPEREYSEEAFNALRELHKDYAAATGKGDPEAVEKFAQRCQDFMEEYKDCKESFDGYMLYLNLLVYQRKWGKVIQVAEPLFDLYPEDTDDFEYLFYFLGCAYKMKKKNKLAIEYLENYLDFGRNKQMLATAQTFFAQLTVQPGNPAPELWFIDSEGEEFDLATDGKGKVTLIDVWGPW